MATPAIVQTGRRLRLMAIDAAAAFKEGAAVIFDAQQEVITAATVPETIIGFACEDAVPTPIDVHPGECLIAVATLDNTFLMELWASSAQIEPVTADIGVDYGIAVDSDGAWYVDQDDETTTVVTVVGIATHPTNAAQKSLVEVRVNTRLLG